MANINNNVQIRQIKKYIKIPHRRLFSGLLYINVVNHNNHGASDADADTHDDFVQQVYDVDNASSGSVDDQIEYSTAFADGGNASQSFVNRGRDGMKHSFADYDCFVFHVCGGMSLSGGPVAPAGGSVTTAVGGGQLAGLTPPMAQTTDGGSTYQWIDTGTTLTNPDLSATWYQNRDNPYGDYCSHFVKHHLLSRINNASGHIQTTDGSRYYKHRPQLKREFTITDDMHFADAASIEDKYVLSNGVYDTKDSRGTALGGTSIVTLGTGNSIAEFHPLDNTYDPPTNPTASDEDGNTYYSPVDRVAIYGQHQFTPASHTAGSSAVHSTAGSGAIHVTDYWDLVIDIGLRGNNPSGSSSAGTSNKAVMKSQINVSFQPFGETQTFSVSDNAHTS